MVGFPEHLGSGDTSVRSSVSMSFWDGVTDGIDTGLTERRFSHELSNVICLVFAFEDGFTTAHAGCIDVALVICLLAFFGGSCEGDDITGRSTRSSVS